jgi:outer membrane protein assembly factor BamB
VRRARVGLALCVAAAASITSAAGAANWPQWRGPGSQGVSPETGVPTTWGPAANVAWKTALPGSGMSSPIVWGNRVYVTAVIEGAAVAGHRAVKHRVGKDEDWIHPDSVAGDRQHTFKVLALDAASGKVLWDRTAYDGPVYDARHRRSSFAGPTPVTDGAMIYAYFGPEGLYAYDVAGKLVWHVREPFRHLGLGAGTSPVLHGDLVIVQRDEDNGEQSVLVAYDRKTGKEAWRTKRSVEISWSTPVLVEASGRTELVTVGSDRIIAYDPRTGRELWQTPGVQSNAIHTPLVLGSTSTGDGLVIATAGYPEKRVIAIRPGDVPADRRVAWTFTRGTGYVISNLLYGEHLYLFADNGLTTCLDARTGEVRYEGGRVPKPARFMGSPVAYGGYIALTSEEGDTFMIKAGPVHEIAHTNAVGEPVYSSPAIANGRIYIRGDKHLFAFALRR